MITPLSWLKKSHSLHVKLLKNGYFSWIKLLDNSQAKINIGCVIPLSIYIYKHARNEKMMKTEIHSILNNRKIEHISHTILSEKYSIPLTYHTIFDKIREKIVEHTDLLLKCSSKTVQSEGKQISINDIEEDGKIYGIDTYRIRDGYFVKKMKEKHPAINERKLILANKSSLRGGFIDDGNFGLVGNHKFYVTGEKLDMLEKFFSSNLCDVIVNLTKYGQDFVDTPAFEYIPDIRKICSKKYNIEKIYNYFGFSKKEIEMIETIR